MSAEFYERANQLLKQGQPFVTASVVRAEKPTSAKPGDKAIITPDGAIYGWIGGSCAQPTIIKEALKVLGKGEPRLIRLSANPHLNQPREGLLDLPMTCFSGGTLEIYIEPQLPTPRLVVVGNLPIAQALCRLGKAMHYRVIALDLDADHSLQPAADVIITDLTQLMAEINPLTYVVVASHGNYDEIALEQVLRSKAAYVALVTSKTRAAAVLEYLEAQGLTPDELARLKYPAGLNISAKHSDEIALSIMAEIIQKRRTTGNLDLEAWFTDPPAETPASAAPTEAIDPVCGMSVSIAGAKHTFEYGNQTYYFCCPGCRYSFKKNPEKYLLQPTPTGEATDPVCGMSVLIATAKYMSIYEDQAYYFCAASCKLAFDKAPANYLPVAPTQ